MSTQGRNRRFLRGARGFTLIELMVVVGIVGVVTVIALPETSRTMAGIRLRSDGRNIANAISLAKMRAGSANSRARILFDTSTDQFFLQVFNRTNSAWETDGGTMSLSPGVSFGFSGVAAAPASTQVLIGQSPPCTDASSPPNDIDGTACVTFNSRGIPIDSSGSPFSQNGIYITDGTGVYGTTVTATPLIRRWWSPAQVAAWVRQ